MAPEVSCPEIDGVTFVIDMAGKCVGHFDPLSFASQTGRLDLVSGLLAVLAIFLAVASVAAFVEVRSRAKKAAKAAARQEASRQMRRFLDEEAPGIIRAHMDLIAPVQGTLEGDEISKKVGEGDDDKGKQGGNPENA